MTELYFARWVLPMASPPVENGAVAIAGSRVIGTGPRAELVAQFPDAVTRDFGEAAILPGFVNAHSHLELTAMRGYLEREEPDFRAWLGKLTLTRLERMTPDDLYVSAAWGAVEAARAGVTCLADASDAGAASMQALNDVGLRGIVYQESFGPNPANARENFELLREKVMRLREFENERVRIGVSPHAPYTVSPPQLELIADFARAENLPLMMHAAESEAEELFMLHGRGPFAEGLARRGIEWRAPGVSTIQHLARHGILAARPLLAHCIRVDAADLETIRAAGAGIAHCPKSNAKLGHARAPFAAFVALGIRVGFGSDSVASNNLCDLLEEMRFAVLAARADGAQSGQWLNADVALQTATMGGARALGLEAETGTLAPGMRADITVVHLGGAHQTPLHDPLAALVFASSGRDVLMTMVAGQIIFSDGRVHTVDEDRLRARMEEVERKVISDK
ncbi:MAG TPA: amidohydrolase family protein [Pyrinomonadaceae bacterium]|nr:amidohydrolase family protein [Pyrinomonadaceae bacterium]